MRAASTTFHLFHALRRAVGRVLLVFLIFLVVPALIVEVAAYFVAGHPAHYQPSVIADVIAAVVGLSLGYAAALTILVKEVIGFTITTIQTIEQDVKSEVTGGSNLLDSIVQKVQSGWR